MCIRDRHCTILKNAEVYCFIDHGSEEGTFLEGKRLESGKTYFYKENDTVQIAKYNARIEMKTVPIIGDTTSSHKILTTTSPSIKVEGTEIRNFKELNVLLKEASIDEEEPAEVMDELDNIDVEEVELDGAILEHARKRKTTRNKLKKKIKEVDPTGNALLRMLGLSCEVIIGLIVVNVFYVFVDFKNFAESLPSLVGQFSGPLYELLFKAYLDKLLAATPLLNSFFNEVILNPNFTKILIFILLVFCLRILSVLVFGVTIGQKLIGLKVSGNIILTRIQGFFREAIGFILFPFVVFDLPCLFGKRTFKEILTGSRLSTESSFISLILGLLLIPILGALFLLSPLVKGLEVLKPKAIDI